MGVAPEAIVESFSSISSSRLFSCILAELLILSGVCLVLSIVVAPEAIVESVFSGIYSKISAP
jgi:hypothetical protein